MCGNVIIIDIFTFATFRIMSFQDLSTIVKRRVSLGSCRWMSGALNIASRYIQVCWHVCHSSCTRH